LLSAQIKSRIIKQSTRLQSALFDLLKFFKAHQKSIIVKIGSFVAMGYWKIVDWKKEFKLTLMLMLFGLLNVVILSPNAFRSFDIAVTVITISCLQWILLWQGNGHMSDYISTKIDWLERPLERFIYGVIGVFVYTPIAILILFLVAKYGFGRSIIDFKENLIISLVVTFVISIVLNAIEFLKNWRKAALDAERLEKEHIASQYETLKNQVNPHFLFNSLNALTNLVYEDQDQAAKFIRELSKVYRYVLDTRAQELVSLQTEIDFANSFIFLQKIRFDEKLQITVDIAGAEQKFVPPMVIQMLLENAIKHNIISQDDPLHISIAVSKDDEMLVIKNNLQIKKIPLDETSGMGLENIKSRYKYLSKKAVEITNGPKEFIVKLPLLDVLK
jgi:sensor histidine kinase YesM